MSLLRILLLGLLCVTLVILANIPNNIASGMLCSVLLGIGIGVVANFVLDLIGIY